MDSCLWSFRWHSSSLNHPKEIISNVNESGNQIETAYSKECLFPFVGLISSIAEVDPLGGHTDADIAHRTCISGASLAAITVVPTVVSVRPEGECEAHFYAFLTGHVAAWQEDVRALCVNADRAPNLSNYSQTKR
jgi:hypothetical protein